MQNLDSVVCPGYGVAGCSVPRLHVHARTRSRPASSSNCMEQTDVWAGAHSAAQLPEPPAALEASVPAFPGSLRSPHHHPGPFPPHPLIRGDA